MSEHYYIQHHKHSIISVIDIDVNNKSTTEVKIKQKIAKRNNKFPAMQMEKKKKTDPLLHLIRTIILIILYHETHYLDNHTNKNYLHQCGDPRQILPSQ